MKLVKFIIGFSLVVFLFFILSVYYSILVYGSVQEYCNGEYSKTNRCTFFICNKEVLPDSFKCKPCLEDLECPCEKEYEVECSSKYYN